MKQILTLLILSALLIGCNQGPSKEDYDALVLENEKLKSKLDELKSELPDFDDYLGLWERTDGDRQEVMKITRDGETFLFHENILRNEDAMVLNKQDGQLSLAAGFGGMQFGLSGDKQVLRFANQSYKKISDNRLSEIIAEREKNEVLCNSLKEEYDKERDIITEQNGSDLSGQLKKRKELKEQYDSKGKEISNCVLWLF